MYQSPFLGTTCWSFIGPEPGGPELMVRVKEGKKLIFPGLRSQLSCSRSQPEIYICIYIDRDRDRERERKKKKGRKTLVETSSDGAKVF